VAARWLALATVLALPVLPCVAQDTAAVKRDSLARGDTLRQLQRRSLAPRDSVKAPLARAEARAWAPIGSVTGWNRDSIFSSGALTLGELVEAIPGVSVFRTGWLASPHLAAYLGRMGRVRVFYDGIELDALDPRAGGILDLSFVETWPLEEVRVEQGPEEVRVHLRSWRVQSTTPVTRVDIHTGDLETNTYRGYYGRRFGRGQALQLGAYQYGTTDVEHGGDADQTSLWGRAGWATGPWSVDASILRVGRQRGEQLRGNELRPPLPAMDAASTIAYARLGMGDPESRAWLQAVVARQQFALRNPPKTVIDSVPGPGGGGPGGSPEAPDTILVSGDTVRSTLQYLVGGGVALGRLRLSGNARVRAAPGETRVLPAVRASVDAARGSLTALLERSGAAKGMHAELGGRLVLLPPLAVDFSVERSLARGATGPISSRLGAGVRLGRLWIAAGTFASAQGVGLAPILFDTGFRAPASRSTRGSYALARGKIFRDIGIDFTGLLYDGAAPFRPRYQTRTRLYFDSDMRERFPSGNLHILIALTHDYRTQVPFPSGTTELLSSQYRTWGLQVEVRLLSATLSYQLRNFMNEEYSQVPGFVMPRPINFYGVRWEFWN
jgi:hypothetical protein